MTRLVVYGCSLTYGTGLDDCWDAERKISGPYASKYSWPSNLAKMLNRHCENLSIPGASNKEICDRVLNTDFNSDDFVICNWTYAHRYCIFKNYKKVNKFRPDLKTIDNKYYYAKIHTDYDSSLDLLTRINLAYYYLENKNVIQYHLIVDPKDFVNTKWNCVEILPISTNSIRKKFGKANDDQHPDINFHLEFAKKLYPYIRS